MPIVGGIAYIRNDNIKDMGGAVPGLEKGHQIRLYEELVRRMDEDEAEATVCLSICFCEPSS